MSDMDEGDVPYVGRYCRSCGVRADSGAWYEAILRATLDVDTGTGASRLDRAGGDHAVCCVNVDCAAPWPAALIERAPYDGGKDPWTWKDPDEEEPEESDEGEPDDGEEDTDRVSPLLSARLVRRADPTQQSRTCSYELVAVDAKWRTSFDVTLDDLGDGQWRATGIVGGRRPDPGASCCDGDSQEAALERLAVWATRLAQGLALLVRPGAEVQHEIVTITARRKE